MKFSTAIALIPTVAAGTVSLRGNEPSYALTDQTQVVLKGIEQDLTASDAEVLEKSLTAAYNTVFKGATYTEFSMDLTAGIENLKGCEKCPDDDMIESGTLIFANRKVAGCEKCPDDAVSASGLSDFQIKAMQPAFEKTFCQMLGASGASTFANVHGCSVRYIANMNLNTAEDETVEETQVVLDGVNGDLTPMDIKIFEQSMSAAYNEAYGGKTNSHFSLELSSDINVKGCEKCPDDWIVESGKLLLASRQVQGCEKCPDDDNYMSSMSASKLEKMEATFETLFCNKLANSGSKTYAEIHSCSFRSFN